ncbi:MAG: ATPase, T2SS/T4P/T4SS family, partial [Oscillospiraceae bacterium]
MSSNVVIPGSICSKLIDAGIINEAQLLEALEIQKTSKALIGAILTQLGYCTEDDIARILAKKTGYKYISINEIGVDVSTANLITPEMALRNNILPLYREDKTLYVAMKNPNDIITLDNLHLMTGFEICPVIVADMELAAAIENFANMNSAVDSYDEDEEADLIADSEELSLDDKPAVQLVNQVINNAIKNGVSDIHIEAMEKVLRIRYRIDGVLQEISQNPIKMFASVVSRVKVLGGMD